MVDELGLDDIGELFRHWARDPPMPVVVKAWLGVQPAARDEEGPRKTNHTEAEVEAMRRELQAFASALNGRPGAR